MVLGHGDVGSLSPCKGKSTKMISDDKETWSLGVCSELTYINASDGGFACDKAIINPD
jgi:hypothetical protein